MFHSPNTFGILFTLETRLELVLSMSNRGPSKESINEVKDLHIIFFYMTHLIYLIDVQRNYVVNTR